MSCILQPPCKCDRGVPCIGDLVVKAPSTLNQPKRTPITALQRFLDCQMVMEGVLLLGFPLPGHPQSQGTHKIFMPIRLIHEHGLRADVAALVRLHRSLTRRAI